MIILYWLIPIPFFLLSTMVFNGNIPLCATSCFILFSSYLGSFKGLFFSSFSSFILLFYAYPTFFITMQPSLFLLITLMTGILAALVKESYVSFFTEDQKEKKKVLEHLNQMKERLAFLELELETGEKERFLEALSEDIHISSLLSLLSDSERRSAELEAEILELEKIVQVTSIHAEGKIKASHKRKPKEPKSQGLLDLMLD